MRRNFFWRYFFIFLLIIYAAERFLKFSFFMSKSLIPILLVIWGISVLSRGSRHRKDYRERQNYHQFENGCTNEGYYGANRKDIIFSKGRITAAGNEKKYSIIFSEGRIDTSGLLIPVDNRMLKIDVIFSNGTITINEDIPAVIRANGVFSSVSLPDNSNITFGEHTYVTRSYRDGAPHYYIEINSIFSSTVIFSQVL